VLIDKEHEQDVLRTPWLCTIVTISKDRGFTLIELMIVVAILGIVAAIAMPNFLRYRVKATQAEARTNLVAIFVAETAFFSDRGQFGNFSDIGFVLAGNATNRYTYRTGLGIGAGLGPNGGNLCGASGSCDTIQTVVPMAGVVAFTGPVGNAVTSMNGFTATAAANLDSDLTHDGWYINDVKQGLSGAQPDDVSS